MAAPFKPEAHHLNEEETVLSFEVAGKIIAACGNDCAACPRYIAHPYEKTSEELQHTAELWMKIMKNMIEYAREHQICRIDLVATDEGYPIYKKLGFEDKAQKYTDMRLKL